jgi:hypothetical protein
LQDGRGVQAAQRAGEFRLRPVRSSDGISANTPTVNSTGAAKAQRNLKRGSSA